LKKKYIKEITKKISNIENVISVSLVGSFFEKELNEISDIDFVVIVDVLNKKTFDNVLNEFLTFNHQEYLGEYQVKINSTFGPMKIYDEKKIIFHIMIYDLVGHVEHVIKSPFTSFDWERSNNFVNRKIEQIFSVNRLMLSDFIMSRRGIKDYKKDLSQGKMTIREYSFININQYEISKKKIPLDSIHLTEYSYHIVKNLLNNYLKFILNTNKSSRLNKRNYEKYLPLVYGKYEKQFEAIKNKKLAKLPSSKDDVMWVQDFLYEFHQKIKLEYEGSTKLIFLRHAKTKENNRKIFLGKKIDPEIINSKIQSSKYKNYKCYTSPAKRAKQTAIKYGINEYTESSLLQEIDYGDADGMNIQDFLLNHIGITEAWSRKEDPRFPNGENNEDVLNRVISFISNIENKDSIIVTHQVFLRCLFGQLFNIPMNTWHLLNIPHNTPLEVLKIKNEFYPNITRKMYKQIFKNFIYSDKIN
jgi:broad specificity phosphatase PhoE/predicted nucleotidyltransferase